MIRARNSVFLRGGLSASRLQFCHGLFQITLAGGDVQSCGVEAFVAEQGGDLFQRHAVVEQGFGEGVAAGVRGDRRQPGQFCQPGNRQK